MKCYINNLETGHIELHFNKEDFKNLSDIQKKELKGAYLWSRTVIAWVSRSTKNHYWAVEIAKKLGFTEEEKQGQKLTYEEELQVKTEKAEKRADKYEYKAELATEKGKNLQKELNSYHGDIAFFTQPIIVGHAGSQAFSNRREKIFNRYRKGFEEYRKSEYYQERAETAKATADMKQFKNPVYLDNRIKETNSIIKKLESNIVHYEDMLYKKENGLLIENNFYNDKSKEQIETWLNNTLVKTEYEIDKLAYLQNALDTLAEELKMQGKKLYNKEDIKKGYLIKVRGSWARVLKTNPKTVEGDYLEAHLKGCYCLYSYSEIQNMKIPNDWKEEIKKVDNPFVISDIVVSQGIGSKRILHAYQVIKITAKTITIQEIEVKDNKPLKDIFKSDKQERKTVKKDREDNTVVNDGNWYLYKYSA